MFVSDHPSLLAAWHPTKNGKLDPSRIVDSSSAVVWWRCPAGPDHEWRASPGNRKRGSGCPCCCNKKVSVTNSLGAVRPDLAREWHPTRNGTLTPRDVTPGSSKRVIWRCAANPRHVWEACVYQRKAHPRCPFCTGRRLSPERSLAARRPDLARQWHPDKNGKLTPRDVSMGSPHRAWWRCARIPSHEWLTAVAHRTGDASGCPMCSGKTVARETSLATVRPDLAQQWHIEKNGGLKPSEVTAGSPLSAWWRCPKDARHEWRAQVAGRTAGHGCPFCSGRRLTPERSLAARYPAIASEWHPTKNGNVRPEDVAAKTPHYAYWRCKVNPWHEWRASIGSRTCRGSGCPHCYNESRSRKKQRKAVRVPLRI